MLHLYISSNDLHPVSTKNRYPRSPNERKEKKGEVNESMNDKNESMNDKKDKVIVLYCFEVIPHYMSHDVSRFSRSAQQRESGEQIKAFLKFSKIAPLDFFFVQFERYQQLVNKRG